MIQTVAIYTAIGIIVGLSQSAGMGGGAIVNVLLMMGLGYSSRESIPITYIFLMGGGLASTFASLKKKSLQGKSLIQSSLVVSTLPTMMCGAIIGTIVNGFLSQLIIAISFIFLTCYLLMTAITKLKEKQLDKKDDESFKSTVESDQATSVKSEIIVADTEIVKKIGQKQKNIFSLQKIKIVLHIYAYTFITIIFKGSKTVESLIGLENCSIGSWICVVVHIILSFLYAKSLGYQMITEDEEKQKLGYIFDANEKMDNTKVKYGMGIGLAAGFLGGALSIGGGVVLVPLWLKMGIDKNTAISSTGPLMFLSASTSFLVSVVLGKYDGVYSVLLFLGLSFASSYLIKNAVLYLVQKYNWNNLVLILLSITLTASLLTFIPTQYLLFTQNPSNFTSFQNTC